MKYISCWFFIFSVATSFAQANETFDVATYTAPGGWKKTSNTNNVVGYSATNIQKGTYCQIAIYASTNSKGSLLADFESEWEGLIVKPYKPTAKPELIAIASENGWDMQGGTAPFEFTGAPSAATLITASGNGRCISVVVLTNTQDYQPEIDMFLESVHLRKIEPATIPVTTAGDNPSVLGVWTMSTSDQTSWRVNNGVMNSITRQYTFKENGTYTFITKTFDPLMDKLLLGKENGTFEISGNNLTIIPQKSVLEGWSKKAGTSAWGVFISSQNIALEKVTYQFTKHYFSGIQEWSLVLQAPAPTKREGPFSSNTSFTNAYYYSPISASHPLIELP